jgi:putative protease
MVEMKPDAFIMADPWLIYLVKKEFPDIVIHLSVQANNTNWAQVQFWKEIWIKRIILSREISIKEMKEIREKVPDIELETFIHGAICMAYSWRCLISNYLSNRDPNQWTCSHSCRWEYKVFKNENSEAELETATWRPENYKELTGNYYLEEKERPWELMEIDEDEYWTYLMNSRDLCAIDYIEDLKNAWIVSFKVEWRNKTVNYIASVGMAYRKAIDAVEKWEKYDSKELARELFSIANRWYIPWFLAWNPNENAKFYERNWTFGTKVFLWILRDYDEKNKLVRVEVKNRFNLWDEIEVVSPLVEMFCQNISTRNLLTKSSDIFQIKKMKVEKIYKTTLNHWTHKANTTFTDFEYTFNKKRAESVNEAHGWGYEVWINMDERPGEFSLIRKEIW